MQKPSAVVVSVLLAFSLFSPVACFAEPSASTDCCGCMGDHGGYECVNGECVDGTKPHSHAPSGASSYDPPPARDASSSARDSGGSSATDAGGDDAETGGCRTSLDCPVGQWCSDGACE
jgi:hypothetical protein